MSGRCESRAPRALKLSKKITGGRPSATPPGSRQIMWLDSAGGRRARVTKTIPVVSLTLDHRPISGTASGNAMNNFRFAFFGLKGRFCQPSPKGWVFRRQASPRP